MSNGQKGMSLIELLLIVVLVGVMVILMANLPNALGLINKSKQISIAREIAAKQIEDKRNTSFANLVNDTSQITDPRINLLPSGGGSVTVEDCNPQICTNGENVKQISITVSWKVNNKNQSINVKTLIGEGGLNQ